MSSVAMNDNQSRRPSSFHETERLRERLAGLDRNQLHQLLGCLPPYLKTGPAHLISASGKIQRVQVSAKTPHLVKLRFYKRPDCRVGRADRLAEIVRGMIAGLMAPAHQSQPPSATYEGRINSTQAHAKGQEEEAGISFCRQRRAMRILQLWGNGRARISPEAIKRMDRHLSDHDKCLERLGHGTLSMSAHGPRLEKKSPLLTPVSAGAISRAREILHLHSPGYQYPEHRVVELARILESDDIARQTRPLRREHDGSCIARQGSSRESA
jgi:hypothetical protein